MSCHRYQKRSTIGHELTSCLPDRGGVQQIIVVHDAVPKAAVLVGEPLPKEILDDPGSV
jgi:hypothetical protein